MVVGSVRTILGNTCSATPRSNFYFIVWQRDYGEPSSQLVIATMMTYRKTLTKKVVTAEIKACRCVLMLAPRAREAHREAQSRG